MRSTAFCPLAVVSVTSSASMRTSAVAEKPCAARPENVRGSIGFMITAEKPGPLRGAKLNIGASVELPLRPRARVNISGKAPGMVPSVCEAEPLAPRVKL